MSSDSASAGTTPIRVWIWDLLHLTCSLGQAPQCRRCARGQSRRGKENFCLTEARNSFNFQCHLPFSRMEGGPFSPPKQKPLLPSVPACLPACRAKKGKNAAIFEYVSHLLRLSSCSTFFVCPSLPPSVIPFPPARPPARDTRGSTRERKAIVSEHFAIHYSSPLARGRGLRSFGGAVAPWRARAQLRRGCR